VLQHVILHPTYLTHHTRYDHHSFCNTVHTSFSISTSNSHCLIHRLIESQHHRPHSTFCYGKHYQSMLMHITHTSNLTLSFNELTCVQRFASLYILSQHCIRHIDRCYIMQYCITTVCMSIVHAHNTHLHSKLIKAMYDTMRRMHMNTMKRFCKH
jgi:hypothetical protein